MILWEKSSGIWINLALQELKNNLTWVEENILRTKAIHAALGEKFTKDVRYIGVAIVTFSHDRLAVDVNYQLRISGLNNTIR